ncbi:MAG: UbiA prenyltransferase family protein [Eubacteriales bacterium]|nr:UbiA prenyltransferase family protein [Eubacteriales bacterium]
MKQQIANYINLIRLKQWIKNGIIFFPMFFSKQISAEIIFTSIIAFFSFSLLASSIYIYNDIIDVEKDRLHPIKCERPIAKGSIGIFQAKTISVCLVIIGYAILILNRQFDLETLLSVSVIYWMYYFLNIFYSIKGKNIPLVDIAILASGFLLRLFFGAFITDIKISNWLYMLVLFGAFYLGLGKRRNEFKRISENSKRIGSRTVLKFYTYSFLDKNMYLCLTLAIMFYALWCAEYQGKSNLLIFTIPLVLLIAMKYNMVIENDDAEGDPVDTILNDKIFLLLSIILIVALIFILYIF